MKARTASRLAWGLWGLVVALVVGTLTLLIANRSTVNGAVVVLYAIGLPSSLAFATVGRLIASRQPGNPIGWLFCCIAISLATFGFANEYGVRAFVTAPGSLPARTFVAWLTGWVLIPTLPLTALVFLLFPDGRLLSRRWRPVVWALMASSVAIVVSVWLREGLTGGRLGDFGVRVENPTGIGHLDVGAGIGAMIAAGAVLASGLAMILRYRRAAGEERQQLRWLAYIGILIAVTIPLTILGPGWFIMPVVTAVLALGIPVASGIAILKYRLYDLDVVVKKTLVVGILVGFVTLMYAAVVIAIPSLVLGAGSDRSLGVSALYFGGAVVVALAFLPLRAAARRLADRLVYGHRATPYEVLSDFSDRLADAYSIEDVLPRMVQIVAAGTAATEARVWLRLGNELRPAASWPADAEAPGGTLPLRGDHLPEFPPTSRAFEVRHQGELLGALTVSVPRSDPLTPSQEKLLHDLAAQAGLVLRNVRLIKELRASRQRLVQAQDAERRRIERNIHDGAQQQLVALSVKLRLADALVDRDAVKAHELLAELQEETGGALKDLRDLARGIYPPLLADKGLAEALAAQARKTAVPVQLDAPEIGRYPQDIEAAVYFCSLEALQNVAKYASASHAIVRVEADDGALRFSIEDDGCGFDPGVAQRGTGLQNMADRVEALGGSLEVRSTPGAGTTVAGTIPARERVAT